jgi:DNA-binding FrmR family transcriptional regulator
MFWGYLFLDIIPPGGIMYGMKDKQKLIRRLKIIEGQVRGLKDMIETGVYCIDVITQTSAVKQALSGVEDLLMENHLDTCVTDQVHAGKSKKATDEILKVYRLKRK